MNSITKELREYTETFSDMGQEDYEKVLAIADSIDTELSERYVALPLDADGEIIRVGDDMERGKAHGRVIALMLSKYPKKWGGEINWGVQLEGEQAPTALDSFFRHHQPDTWERIIADAVGCMDYEVEEDDDLMDLVARCKALAGGE